MDPAMSTDECGSAAPILTTSTRMGTDLAARPRQLIVAFLIYFLWPVDLIPDFRGPAGYVDDAALLVFVLGLVKEELDDFLQWERRLGAGMES